MCEGQSGCLGAALSSSISGMAREEAGVSKPVTNGCVVWDLPVPATWTMAIPCKGRIS